MFYDDTDDDMSTDGGTAAEPTSDTDEEKDSENEAM
jgi:hypothetical protein